MDCEKAELVRAVQANRSGDFAWLGWYKWLVEMALVWSAVLYCALYCPYCLIGLAVLIPCVGTIRLEILAPVAVCVLLFLYFEWAPIREAVVIARDIRQTASEIK